MSNQPSCAYTGKKKLQHDGFCWVHLFLSFSCLLTTSYAQLIPKSSLAFSLKGTKQKNPTKTRKPLESPLAKLYLNWGKKPKCPYEKYYQMQNLKYFKTRRYISSIAATLLGFNYAAAILETSIASGFVFMFLKVESSQLIFMK